MSRYSYLVSLLPERVQRDLGLRLELRSRRTASYTPARRQGRPGGLLVERPEGTATRASFRDLTGADDEYAAWQRFHADAARLASVVEPTLTDPLPREDDLREPVGPEIWDDFVGRPLGHLVEQRFTDDLVRGVVATDGLIGTFADLDDPARLTNRCFLYHVIGNGDGEWRVPVGGMGAVTDALGEAATRAGAEVLTGAEVTGLVGDDDGVSVTWHRDGRAGGVEAGHVLSGVSPWTLSRLTDGRLAEPPKPEGSQLKVNLLVDRLPRLRSGADPSVAFAGTFHVAESMAELRTSYAEAAAGQLPQRIPGELYCHTLTDPSILSAELRERGSHTLTYFGLHTPASVFAADPEALRDEAVRRVVAALDEHLAEPLADCLSRDRDGNPCIEAKIPQDLERELGLPGGHIFHEDLAWPWAPHDQDLDSPARAWGVATGMPRVLLCGSGAVRGGAVSGIGGHNAAQAVLAEG